MRKRDLGKTSLRVSELALGTWGLSGGGYGKVAETESEKVIDRARAFGINLIDTAPDYGNGDMERRLGERLKSDSDVCIVTKVGTNLEASPPRKQFDADFMRTSIEKSAERLQREPLDVVLLHNPSLEALGRDEVKATLVDLKHEGAMRAWGVSAGTLEVAERALDLGAEVVSIAYNLFCLRPMKRLLGRLQSTGAGVLAHSVLAYGMLCGQWAAGKQFPEGDHRAERWTTEEFRRRIRQLNAVRPLVGGPITTMRAGALRYVLHNKLVSSAILGPRSSLQLDQLVREAGKGPPYLPPERVAPLETRLRTMGIET